MQLLKVHGSENDFFILDEESLEQTITDQELRELARKLCDRKNGLHGGADGVLYVTRGHEGTNGRMRVINADGSEASMCGNGIRTVARYLSEKTGRDDFKIQTMYADLEVKRTEPFAAGVPAFAAEISPVSFAASDLGMHIGKEQLLNDYIPELSTTIKFSAVAVPNPHLIAFVDHETISGDKLGEIGRYLNDGQNPLFPDGVNVSFIEILGPNKLFVRTFERGVGYTNACGTGMSASSLIYFLVHGEQTGLEQTIQVINPGGMVKTIIHQKPDQSYWISLIGNATETATVELPVTEALAGDFTHVVWTDTGEQTAYKQFVTALKEGK